MGKRKTQQNESAILNNASFLQYYNRLLQLSMTMFDWQGLPETVDQRYIEMTLFTNGSCVYFRDEVLGDLCLSCIQQSNFNVYGEPNKRRAYSQYNNYQRELSIDDSVMVWNNYLRTNCEIDIRLFAQRLYNLDRIMDVNANAQKTPILIQGNEKQKLSLKNLFMQYDGNMPVIFGYDNLDLNGLSVLKTDAPYVCDKIWDLKSRIWNEALTYLGISNMTMQKKANLITDEVQRSQGGVIASRYSRLQARRESVERINRMFGTDIEVNYREDMSEIDTTMPGGGELNE